MDNPIVQAVLGLILDVGNEYTLGTIGKIRLCFIRRTLKCKITKEILRRYGNEPYYNALDHFLLDKDVISSIIRNCFDTSISQYKSKEELVTYYVQLFMEHNPNYRKYHYQVRAILQKYFEIIYLALNRSKNEETRIICNVAKELSQGLRYEQKHTNTQLKLLTEQIGRLVPGSEDSTPHLSLETYVEYLLRLHPKYSSESYLKRNIYPVDNQNNARDCLDVVLQEKCVLILGEAGFGKTYESITLLHKACANISECGSRAPK